MRRTLYFLTIVAVAAACNSNKIPPEDAAKSYLEALKIPYTGVSCTSVDTDNDGYVTCTVSQPVSDKNAGKPELMMLNCAALGANAGGCKPK